ncbi:MULTISPECIES: DUF484 family protein [unclassified Pusillimonas]|uniref:DUF484 family protein n=1 Tax=unclassified Pusillimonas TaxID=2640016 RepID=UPI000B8EAD84|nr:MULTISPECIES: DUF484 family protein [unclassified Pusillimonas]OXR48979.1 hypothetical protein PuT2_10380 [Pusillimonas sp. T2]ROT45837.1 DUF484 domain-containing protein [Pusillimonas sp. NJUB218]
MTTTHLSADEVALFLRENPGFFHEHADVFADLRVPHPHETRAISLGERQILTLRAKAKDLEWKLSGLINNASGNEKISRTLTAWCARMLAEPDAEKIPAHIIDSLANLFELPDTTLRLLESSPRVAERFTQDVSDDIRLWAQALPNPYCGPTEGHAVSAWLSDNAQSMAVVPLRAPASGKLLGLLVIGSAEADRFEPDMGTAFLEIIGELSASALTRLLDPHE